MRAKSTENVEVNIRTALCEDRNIKEITGSLCRVYDGWKMCRFHLPGLRGLLAYKMHKTNLPSEKISFKVKHKTKIDMDTPLTKYIVIVIITASFKDSLKNLSFDDNPGNELEIKYFLKTENGTLNYSHSSNEVVRQQLMLMQPHHAEGSYETAVDVWQKNATDYVHVKESIDYEVKEKLGAHLNNHKFWFWAGRITVVSTIMATILGILF